MDAVEGDKLLGVRGDLLDGPLKLARVPNNLAGERSKLDASAGEKLKVLLGEGSTDDPVHARRDGGPNAIELVGSVNGDNFEVDGHAELVGAVGKLSLKLRGRTDVLEADVDEAAAFEAVEHLERVLHGAVVAGEHEDELRHFPSLSLRC